jgi:nucleoside-diphosphate-sugar epimerase
MLLSSALMNEAYELAVLGAGYVGAELASRAAKRGMRLYAVGRRPHPELGREGEPPFVRRDLLAEGAAGLPETRAAVVTFPIPDSEAGQRLVAELGSGGGRMLYLSTTGVYAERGGGRVDESSPVLPGHERVAGETLVRQHGGTVLRLAGLYGPGSDPLRWIERGMLRKCATLINLVHRDDLAEVVLDLLALPALPPVLNVSDGVPLERLRIFELYEALRPEETHREIEVTRDLGKAVSNELLRSLLPHARFRDCLQALRDEWRAAHGHEAAR